MHLGRAAAGDNRGLAELAGCGKTYLLMKSLSAPCDKTGFLPIVRPLAGETTEGEAGCEDFFSSLLVGQAPLPVHDARASALAPPLISRLEIYPRIFSVRIVTREVAGIRRLKDDAWAEMLEMLMYHPIRRLSVRQGWLSSGTPALLIQ